MQVLVDFTRLIVLDASIRRRVEPENLKIDRNLPEQSNHIDSSIRRTSRCNWDCSICLSVKLRWGSILSSHGKGSLSFGLSTFTLSNIGVSRISNLLFSCFPLSSVARGWGSIALANECPYRI